MSPAADMPEEDRPPVTGGLLPPSADDEETSRLNPDEPLPITEGRDRKELASSVELNPGSLAGSFFHRIENGEMVWDGLVVAEVQPGYYLVQVYSGLEGAPQGRSQVLQTLDEMIAKDEGYEYRFYDNEDAMRAAFADYSAGRR